MKKTKKVFLCAITLVIAGLVITSGAVSMVHSEKNNAVKQVGIKEITKMNMDMDVSVSVINGEKHAIKKQVNNILPLQPDVDVLVHHDIDEENVQNPALVTDAGLSNILIFSEYYEGVGQTGMWGRWSMDMGETWSDDIVGFEAIPEDNPDDVSIPNLDYYQDTMAYGTWTAGGVMDGETYYLELPSIIDPDSGWTYYYVDWAGAAGFSNFDSADVACYPQDAAHSPSADFWGAIFGTGDRPEGANYEDNTMWFSYFVPGGSVTIISFHNMAEDVEKMACDIDISEWQPHFTCEYYKEADPSDNGSLYFKSPPLRPDNYAGGDYWWDGDFNGFYLEDTLTPDIVAAGGSVYIVGQTLDGDIICFYSTNGGDSFEQSMVSQDGAVESFPQVTLKGSDVICTYTRGGNHYVSISEDGGVSWGAEELINDEDGTVVEQYGCTGIDGPFASWTDDRIAPPTEIYFDKTAETGDPPTAPTITGSSIVKKGKEASFIFNSQDPNGDQVKYIIDWGDTTIDETELKPSGTDVTVKHTWNTGGIYTIIAKAEDSTGLIGPQSTKEITVKMKDKALNLPCFKFLQNYPNLLPILKYLLGL